MNLEKARARGARAALRGYVVAKYGETSRPAGNGLFTMAGNPELDADLTDLIADSLLLAEAKGLDPLAILSAALSHVDSLGAAYSAVGAVSRARHASPAPGALATATARGVAIFQAKGGTCYTPGPSAGVPESEWRGPFKGAEEAARAALDALDATPESVRASLESAVTNYGLQGERSRLLRANVNHVLRTNGATSAAEYLAGAERYL